MKKGRLKLQNRFQTAFPIHHIFLNFHFKPIIITPYFAVADHSTASVFWKIYEAVYLRKTTTTQRPTGRSHAFARSA